MNTSSDSQRILCYGDSNTWGWVPGKMGAERYPITKRWPGILQQLLGESYEIIEDGLGARTTAHNDPRPELPLRNGHQTLPITLETHAPIDTCIFMLGTTDTKEMLDLSAEDIRDGMKKLIVTARDFKPINGTRPQNILIVVPPIVDESTEFAANLFKGGAEKGRQLITLYEELAEKYSCMYLDANEYVKVDGSDGVHLNAESHKDLAKKVAECLR